ncbi:MAG: DegV family protein [Bacilli bacterium]|nr:DegV family protein [Bacilli bacterium]
MKIGITADCSSGLEYAPFEHNVKITRTTINFKDKTLVDGIDITVDEFYKMLENVEEVPSTAAPSIGEITARVEEWKKEGCSDVIHFPISFGLSPYGLNMSNLADELFEGINVHFFPSKQACIMQGYVAHYGEKLAQIGKTPEEIIQLCEEFQNRISTHFIVDNLKYLVKNGRLTSVAGFIGTLANIKPVLQVNKEGKIVPFEKVRTKGKAIERIKQLTVENGLNYQDVIYVVLHSNRLEEANKIAEDLSKLVNNARRVEVTTITSTVGAHIGSGVIGITCIPVDNLEHNELI